MLRSTVTENGAVKGFAGTDARITVYKGIPYAAPPVGENRWKAPQPVENWEGVRECYDFAPIPTQRTPGADPNAFYSKEWHVDSEIPMSEDGLYLNIWTPAKSADEKLPVMLWIHGGGMQEGYGYEMEFDGERMASRGVILVSICYRLNIFAFLSHPELTAEDPEHPTNFALLDMAEAIRWCRRNIANFGGDPENITIFGQSGGGDAVHFLCYSPQTKGLFKRAIIQSAGVNALKYPNVMYITSNGRSMSDAEAIGVKFFEFLGIKSLAEARALDANYLLKKYNEFGFQNVGAPVVDGKFVTDFPFNDCINNKAHDVDIMFSATADEFMFGPSDEKELGEAIKDYCGEYADEYYKNIKYMVGSDDAAALRKASVFSMFHAGNRLSAELFAKNGRKVWFALFDPYIPGDASGAFHSCDLWFEFETLMKCYRPFDGHHFDVARKMCNCWTNFAKTGNPNGNDADGTPMPEWRPYTPEDPHAMIFGDEVGMELETDRLIRHILDTNLKIIGK